MVYITTNENTEAAGCCDEVIHVANTRNTEAGNLVSPQCSLLMLLDVLFSFYYANNTYYNVKKYKEMMSAVRENGEMQEEEIS